MFGRLGAYMPANSKAQRELMAIAEHHPDQVNPKNRGVLQMSHDQLHDFAATPEKKLPQYAHTSRHRVVGSHDGMYITEHHRGRRLK